MMQGPSKRSRVDGPDVSKVHFATTQSIGRRVCERIASEGREVKGQRSDVCNPFARCMWNATGCGIVVLTYIGHEDELTLP